MDEIMFGRRLKQSNAKQNNLELKVMRLTDQVENFKRIAFGYQQEYERLVKEIRALSYIILNEEYVNSQLGGDRSIQQMDIYQLIKYMEVKYRQKHSEARKLLSELVDKLDQKEQEVESLKIQLSRLLTREQHLKEYDSEEVVNQEKGEEETAKTTERSPHPLAKSGGNIVKVTVIENKNIKPPEPENVEQKESDESQKKQNKRKNDQPAKERNNISQHSDTNATEPIVSAKQEIDTDEKMEESAQSYDDTQKEKRNIEVISNIKKQIEEKTSKLSDEVMAHVVNLNDYIAEMTDVMWDIMMAIGRDGFSEAKDIKKVIVSKGITESAFNTALSQLRKMNIVDQERINTGWRWFHAYELSEIGRRIYLEKFKKEPVECEKQILKKEHTTALHGYCIKDASLILKVIFEYDEVSTDRQKNSIKLYTGKIYIPDIIAKKKQGSVVDYFEVELGNHTQNDFNKKCDKMLMVTRDLRFIVPDAEIMNKILARQIGQWVLEKGGKEKLKGTTIYLTTLKKLNEGIWENRYPF